MRRFIEISILDVAERCGIWTKYNGNSDEVRARCPFCGKNHGRPTASINRIKNVFYCHKCGEGHNALTLYAKLVGVDNKSAYRELANEDFTHRAA